MLDLLVKEVLSTSCRDSSMGRVMPVRLARNPNGPRRLEGKCVFTISVTNRVPGKAECCSWVEKLPITRACIQAISAHAHVALLANSLPDVVSRETESHSWTTELCERWDGPDSAKMAVVSLGLELCWNSKDMQR